MDSVTRINNHEFEFHNAHCFKIDVPQIGSTQAIYYDVAALKVCYNHIKKNHVTGVVKMAERKLSSVRLHILERK